MNESLLAGRYAKALLAYADEVGEADALYPILLRLGRTLRRNYGAEMVVSNPTLSEQMRCNFVVALAGEKPPVSLERFVRLVFDHNREQLLGEMARAYTKLYRQSRGITHAKVTATHKMESEALERLKEIIRNRRGGDVELEEEIDPELLGGFVLHIEGEVLDASAKGQIERIRQQFIVRNRSIV
ncbi:MAG: ATP synthase F1 subunit delta [Tidjanibacter sp.]|nr:ATP synthase F1 subunit delta [Tidjanibacter sp.]